MCVSCIKTFVKRTLFGNNAKYNKKKKNQVCVYTKEELEELLKTAKAPLSNYIKSQLNVYHTNCNSCVDKIKKYDTSRKDT